MNLELIDTLHVSNELGEGIIWDTHRQRVWWTDILQRKLYRYDPVSKNLENWNTPERLCCFAPVEGQNKLICAFESGFAFYWPENDELKWITRLEEDNPGTRFNDGRTDRQGRLWAGTMVENENAATYKGSLYCLDTDLHVTKTLSGLSITNSLCWSPDGNILYHTDTVTQTINRYPFDTNKASLGEAQAFVSTEKNCYPDGSIIDAEGYLWNAQWGGSQIVRYSPQGAQDLKLTLPTSQPTCLAFGGRNLDLLFVTTAWSEMSPREELAGSLFIYQTNFKGLEEAQFKLSL